ncbi:hypothetical protein [Thiohalobacter sp.]|uniref:hypothetical protein n=1 Tax=Thiohalobacter sp. TaxID=2025948 RepID=UPI002615CFBB|nr:hypothetical protein [Thiohalobacter sp.]
MVQKLVVAIDGVSQLEYDRTRPLAPQQQAALEAMDRRMDGGIRLAGLEVPEPDPLQRARFVAEQLVAAIDTEQEALAAATLAWLANRLPELRQVAVRHSAAGRVIDLVFDRDHVPEQTVQFHRPGGDA